MMDQSISCTHMHDCRILRPWIPCKHRWSLILYLRIQRIKQKCFFMIILTTEKLSFALLIALRYSSWRSYKLTCVKLRYHILKSIGVDVWRWIVFNSLSITIICTSKTRSWQVHTSVIISSPFCSTRHNKIIQLILIVGTLHRIYCWWWCLVSWWTLFCPLFNNMIHISVMIFVPAHFRLRSLPFNFEFLWILFWITIWVYLFNFYQALILASWIEIIALLLQKVLASLVIHAKQLRVIFVTFIDAFFTQ